MKRHVLITMLLMLAISGYGTTNCPEFLADMASMKRKVAEATSMKARIMVANKNVAGFVPSITGELRKEDNKVYYRILHLEYLFVPGKSYMVDHKSRTISYSLYDNSKVIKFNRVMPDMDSVLSIYDSVVYKGMVWGKRKYCIYSASSVIKYTELYFDTSTSFVSKLVYQYNAEHIGEEATLVVEYNEVDFAPIFRKDEFSENRFVVVKNGNRAPAASYYGYKVEAAITDFDKY